MPPSGYRYRVAADIAATYAAEPEVVAVLLGGSTGRGHPDQFSDIELGIFWDNPPEYGRRHRLTEKAGGHDVRQFGFFEHEQAWYDEFFIGRIADRPSSGVQVEIVHKLKSVMEEQIRRTIERPDPDLYLLNLLSAVAYGQPLSGQPIIDRWRDLTAAYPAPLARAVIEKYGQIDHFWRWSMYLERGPNLPLLYQSWSEITRQLLHLLCAVNGIYYFGFKWQHVVCNMLAIRPARLNERLTAVFARPPAEAAGMLKNLVEETYDIVAAAFPEIDVDRWRQIFAYERKPWRDDGFPA